MRFPKNCDASLGVLRVNFILSEMIMLLDSSTAFRRKMALKASLGPFSALDSPPILVSGSHLLIMMLTTVLIARVD